VHCEAYIITATCQLMSIHFPKCIKQRTYKESKRPFVVVVIEVDPSLDNGDPEQPGFKS
jgi:cytochrome oxidase Cu insertion factor (SCO1/SenC/PrrC family)